MPTLQADNIADLLVATLRDLGRFEWTDIAATLQAYVGWTQLMRKKKVGFSDGTGLQWQVMVTQSNNARNVGLYGVDQRNVQDTMKSCNLPWRHTTNNFAYDRREFSMNRGKSRILDLIKQRRYDCFLGLAEKMETNIWSCPAVDNDVDPHGIPYWIVKSASTGFVGGAPIGYTEVAGLNPSTYTGWKNYAAPYSVVSKADLLDKWTEAADKTNFKAPVEYPKAGGAVQRGYYTAYAVFKALRTLLESQNDNLGNDLDSKSGMATFRRTPVEWVPKLDNDVDEPIYGVNWGTLRPVFLRDEYMREDGPTKSGTAHTVYTFDVDLSYNLECRNRRDQFVLSKGTSGSVAA